MSLITAEEARTWLKIPEGSALDPTIELLIESVSADCLAVVGAPIESTAVDRYLTGDATNVLILPVRPVVSITSISIEGGPALVAGWDKDYVATLSTGLIRLTAGVFPNRPGAVHVVWQAGYAAVPDDLKVSIMRGVAFLQFEQDKRRPGVTHLTTPEQSADYTEEDYPKGVKEVWKRYRYKAGMAIG